MVRALLVLEWAMGNTDTQDSPRPGLGGSHLLPPYNILCISPRGPPPNAFLSRDSQVRIPKLLRLGLPQVWGIITLRANLWLKWGLKQSCSPRQELSNGISHDIFTHKNRVDSQLLVVGSQTANLTSGPSFGHNLCFRCPNGWCEPTLHIQISRSFHWYKELLNPFSFDPYNRPLKIWESTRTPTPKVELPWGVRVHSFTPSHIPCREPKARVVTYKVCKNLRNDKHPSYMKYKTSPCPHFERDLTQRNWHIILQCK
jgi:hypothetical protein